MNSKNSKTMKCAKLKNDEHFPSRLYHLLIIMDELTRETKRKIRKVIKG